MRLMLQASQRNEDVYGFGHRFYDTASSIHRQSIYAPVGVLFRWHCQQPRLAGTDLQSEHSGIGLAGSISIRQSSESSRVSFRSLRTMASAQRWLISIVRGLSKRSSPFRRRWSSNPKSKLDGVPLARLHQSLHNPGYSGSSR